MDVEWGGDAERQKKGYVIESKSSTMLCNEGLPWRWSWLSFFLSFFFEMKKKKKRKEKKVVSWRVALSLLSRGCRCDTELFLTLPELTASAPLVFLFASLFYVCGQTSCIMACPLNCGKVVTLQRARKQHILQHLIHSWALWDSVWI